MRIAKHAIKQRNTVPNKENNQSIKIVQELRQMLKLAVKDFKIIFYLYSIYSKSWDMKDIKKTKDSNRTSRCEKYIFDEKYCGI